MIFAALAILAVFFLSGTLLDNLILRLDSEAVFLSALSITIIVVFLYKRFEK